jgi:soluble lytic murein transglycosylase-like protein
MRFVVIALIVLSCAFLYDFTSIPSIHPHFPKLITQAPPYPVVEAPPVVKTPVDAPAIIKTAARKHKVPEAFVKSIVAAESNFNPQAVSAKGAVGLMQLMPSTAQEYGANAAIPEQNVDAGTQYLGWLLKRYARYRNGLSRAIAAYNAGPGVVDRFRGIPPYRETRTYVSRVLTYFRQYQRELGTTRTAAVLNGRRVIRTSAD